MELNISKSGRFTYRIIFCLFIILLPAPVLSNDKDNTALNIILVIDSTKTLTSTDPNDFRKPAAKLLISRLSSKDKAAVVSFSGDGYKLTDLIPTDSSVNKKILFSTIDKLSSKGNYTNFYGALRTAKFLAEKIKQERQKTLIVFLSDGKMELSSLKKEKSQLKKLKVELIPWFSENAVPIHAVALSENADQILMKYIAIRTEGQYYFTTSAKELYLIFNRIINTVKNQFSLSVINNTFSVKEHYKNLTIIHPYDALNPGFTLIAPDGSKITRQNKLPETEWLQTSLFDLVSLNSWQTGTWEIVGNSNDLEIYSNSKTSTVGSLLTNDSAANLATEVSTNSISDSLNKDITEVNNALKAADELNNSNQTHTTEENNLENHHQLLSTLVSSKTFIAEIRSAIEIFLLVNTALAIIVFIGYMTYRRKKSKELNNALDADFNNPEILEALANNNRADAG